MGFANKVQVWVVGLRLFTCLPYPQCCALLVLYQFASTYQVLNNASSYRPTFTVRNAKTPIHINLSVNFEGFHGQARQ